MGFKIKNGALVKFRWNIFMSRDIIVPDKVNKVNAGAFAMRRRIRSVMLPLTVTDIGSEAFKGCTSLERVTIPGAVKKIGSEVFRNCPSLKRISIPVGVTEIREYSFCNCTSLKTVELPQHLERIETHSFFGCKSLEGITIPSDVKEIADFTFCGCTSLKYISLPKNIVKIGDSAFWNCEELEEVELSEGLKEIGENAFKGCEKLTKIIIPKSVKKIGSGAFADCKLKEVVLQEDSHKIRGIFAGMKIKLTIGSENEADEATHIKSFAEIAKSKYYSPGTVLDTRSIKNYKITCTPLAWEKVTLSAIETMIETSNYYADMYLPVKYSIVAAVFLQSRQYEAAMFIWRHTVDMISYFININDYQTVKGLFECGKFITSENITTLLECAVDKVQNGGDMKIQVLINNYYLLNSGTARHIELRDDLSPEVKGYFRTLDLIENHVEDLRMMLSEGADVTEIAAGANNLFSVFIEFRDSLSDERSQLFDIYSQWG